MQNNRETTSPRTRYKSDYNRRNGVEDHEERKMSSEEYKKHRAQEAYERYQDDYQHENLPENSRTQNTSYARSPSRENQDHQEHDNAETKQELDFSMFNDDFDPNRFGIPSSSEEEDSDDDAKKSRRKKKGGSKARNKEISIPIVDLQYRRNELIAKLEEIKRQDRRTSFGKGRGTSREKIEQEIEYFDQLIKKRQEDDARYGVNYIQISQPGVDMTYSVNMARVLGTSITSAQQQGPLRNVLMIGRMDESIFAFTLARFMGVDTPTHPVKMAFDAANIRELSMFLTMTRKDINQLRSATATLPLGDITQMCVVYDMTPMEPIELLHAREHPLIATKRNYEVNQKATLNIYHDDIVISSKDKSFVLDLHGRLTQLVAMAQQSQDCQPTYSVSSSHLQRDICKQLTSCLMQPMLYVFYTFAAMLWRTSYVDRGVKNYSVGHTNSGVSTKRVPQNYEPMGSGRKDDPSEGPAKEFKTFDPARHE